MVLLDDVVEILHTPQFTILRQDFLFDGGGECLGVRRVLIRAEPVTSI